MAVMQAGSGRLVRDAAPVTPPPRPRRACRRREALWGYAFIAPIGVGLAIFYLWPVLETAYFSLTSWGPFGGHVFTGLANYRTLVHDDEVRQALLNTLLYTALSLLCMPLAIVLAALLNQRRLRGVSMYRTIFFLPVVTMPVAVAMIWRWLYNGDFGIINYLLSLVGIHGPHWSADPATALYALVVVGAWSTVGYNLIIFMAGMQGIPRDLYEAAAVDGASRRRQFFSITIPMLSPSIFFVSVLSVIGSLQLFDLMFVMMGGSASTIRTNPAFARTETIVYLFYDKAFYTNDRGYAASIVMLLLVVIAALTGLQFWLQRRWVHYA